MHMTETQGAMLKLKYSLASWMKVHTTKMCMSGARYTSRRAAANREGSTFNAVPTKYPPALRPSAATTRKRGLGGGIVALGAPPVSGPIAADLPTKNLATSKKS
jgi:hypothetical protein